MWHRLCPQTGNAPQARTEPQTWPLCPGVAMSRNTRTMEGRSSQAAGTVWRQTSQTPIRRSWEPAGAYTNVSTQMQMQGQSRHFLTTAKPNRQRGYQTGQKPPGSHFIIHPRLGISFDLFPCSFHIPLNCHSHPSNAANCLKQDPWVISDVRKKGRQSDCICDLTVTEFTAAREHPQSNWRY